MNESIVKAAVAMMDSEVIQKVRTADDERGALAILSLYDLRFGDGLGSAQWCARLLKYFDLQSSGVGVPSQLSRRKRPGPHSAKRDVIWDYVESHKIGSPRRQSYTLRSRQRLALKIGRQLESSTEFYGAGSKPDSDIMAVLRNLFRKRMSRKRITKKAVRAYFFLNSSAIDVAVITVCTPCLKPSPILDRSFSPLVLLPIV